MIQDSGSAGAASERAALLLRSNASSRPIRTRCRFFMRLPFRGVASHTWRRRTFQIARLLISSGSPNWAGTVGKIPSKRKPFSAHLVTEGDERLARSVPRGLPVRIHALPTGSNTWIRLPRGTAFEVPLSSFTVTDVQRERVTPDRSRSHRAAAIQAKWARQRAIIALHESAFRSAEQCAADSRAPGRRPERERNGLAPAQRLR